VQREELVVGMQVLRYLRDPLIREDGRVMPVDQGLVEQIVLLRRQHAGLAREHAETRSHLFVFFVIQESDERSR